jgi:uncharacterized protein YjbI with pentapeptide repeats
MANGEHLKLIKMGTDVWNRERHKDPTLTPDLTWASLSKANLKGADLSKANLRGAFLRGAVLSKADLTEVNLMGTNLNEADLSGAILVGANLTRANLIGTKLESANLANAILTEADLSNANLKGVDLRNTKNLTLKQLSNVETLADAKMDSDLLEQIKASHPHLLTESTFEDEGASS